MDFASPKLRPYNGPNLLLSGKIVTTNLGKYYKDRQLYYKVGQLLLQSRAAKCYQKFEQEPLQRGAGNLFQSMADVTKWGNFITKWSSYSKVGNYYKVWQYKAYK